MPRQQQLCACWQGRRDTVETCHHAIIQAALVPSQGRHGHNTVNIPTMVTMVTMATSNIVSTVSCSQGLIYYKAADPSLGLCGNQSPRKMRRQQKLSCILMRSCTEHAGAAQDSYDQCLAADCILDCPPYLSSDLGLVVPLSPAPHATAATSGHQRPVDRGMLPG